MYPGGGWAATAEDNVEFLSANNRKMSLQGAQNVEWSDGSQVLLRHTDGRPVNRSEFSRISIGCGRMGNSQLTNLQKLCDAIISTWSRMFKDY